jgi:hypothetical protein
MSVYDAKPHLGMVKVDVKKIAIPAAICQRARTHRRWMASV